MHKKCLIKNLTVLKQSTKTLSLFYYIFLRITRKPKNIINFFTAKLLNTRILNVLKLYNMYMLSKCHRTKVVYFGFSSHSDIGLCDLELTRSHSLYFEYGVI